MSSKATVSLTVGVSGSGKTYYRCAVFLIDEWLVYHTGKLISNYPINTENLFRDFPEAKDRIEIIPDDVLAEWRRGSSGPWDYFSGRDISGCHIAIDEIHNYCGSASDIKVRLKWQQLVGELRHRGATIEFFTQSEAKCSKELLQEAEIRYEIQNGENRRMPILGYRMGDIYELRAKLIGRYLCPSYCIEKMNADGDWHEMEEHMFYRMPSYFQYYNSFSAPMSGGEEGNRQEKRPWEKYGWFKLLLWFFFQYPFRIPFQIGLVVVFCWFFFFGGMIQIMTGMFNGVQKATGHMVKTIPVQKSETKNQVQKVNNRSSGVTANIVDSPTGSVVVRRNPLQFVCPYYFRYNGKEFKLDDVFYDGRITEIHRDGFVIDDLLWIPFSFFDDNLDNED